MKSGGKSSRPSMATRRRASPTRSKAKQGHRAPGPSPGWPHEAVSNCGPRGMVVAWEALVSQDTELGLQALRPHFPCLEDPLWRPISFR